MKCDELKERWFEAYPVEGDQLIPVEVYSKKDTDEAIKEINDKLRYYPMFIAMLESDKLEIAKDKIKIRHHKYKRCLTMAQVLEHVCPMTNRKAKWRDKWQEHWRELAEKFKEANYK